VLTAWNRGAERMFGWTAAEALGHKVYELIPTSLSDEEMAAGLGDLVTNGRWRGEATCYGKHDKPVEAEGLTVALRSEQGQAGGYVCIMRDVAELKGARAMLQTTAREQAVLGDLSLRALGTNHLGGLLDDAARVLADVLAVDHSSITEIEPGGEQWIWRATFGWSEHEIASAPASRAAMGALVGYTVRVGEPVISEDVIADERFGISPMLVERAPVSAAAVVIPGPEVPFGALVAAARTRRSFGSTDIEFMKAVANVIAIAIDRATEEDRIEAARQAERSRIARDLHDEVLRELTDALAQATIARSSSADDQDKYRWGALITAIEMGTRQVRSAIYDLRLSDVDRPFGDLLTELLAIQDDLAGDAQLQLHGRDALGAISLGGAGPDVLRIVTEALTNSRRHSGAATIQVDVSAATVDVLRLEVSDDGAWPDRESAVRTRAGTGIMSMFHRADLLGAKLRIDDRPGGGTRIFLELALAVERSHP
jgi:PAS domain S-box-containing protein